MKNTFIFIIIMIFFTSCIDTYNKKQYLLLPKIDNNNFILLKKEIKIALAPIVNKYKLIDNSKNINKKNIILYYTTNNNFPIQLGMRKEKGLIIMDIMHFHPGTGETKRYKKIINDIIIVLKNLNSYNYIQLNYDSRIN